MLCIAIIHDRSLPPLIDYCFFVTRSIVLCIAIVMALSHLTSDRSCVCAACGLGFDTPAALETHVRGNLDTCDRGMTCVVDGCKNPNALPIAQNGVLVHAVTENRSNSDGRPGLRTHEFVQKRTELRSIVAKNSGIFGALRLTAGLFVAAIVTIFTRGDGVLVAQHEIGDMKTVVAIALSIVVLAAALSLFMSVRTKREQKAHSEKWARLAFLTCEVLLLSTLAYSIPKSYGNEIVVASLFLTGLASSALAGDACFHLWKTHSLTYSDMVLFAIVFLALAVKIIAIMIFPMIVYCDGITKTTAWALSSHVFMCVFVLPGAKRMGTE